MSWTHIYVEAYCLYDSMKSPTIKVKEWKKPGPYKTVNNNMYRSDKKRPQWCINKFGKGTRHLEFRCLCSGKNNRRCPFFAMTDACRKDKNIFNKAYHTTYAESKS